MTENQHHHDALMETARSELERAHAAAVAMTAADIRRGLQLALDALREAAGLPGGTPSGAAAAVEQALTDLDTGKLSEMEHLIEQARSGLTA